MASAGGHWVKVAQGNIGALVFVPVGQSAAQAITGRTPRGGSGFPDSIDDVTVIKGLGGSTGAKLVQDENGNLYVMKKGANSGHLLEESAADNAYKEYGLGVADHKIYNTPGGPVKLAKYVEGVTLESAMSNDPKLAQKAMAELKKGFVVDAVLGNWDVVGLGMDNVLIGKTGKVYRIDNGGSLRYRAQGALKNSFDEFPNEVFSMRAQGSAKQVFGSLSFKEVARQSAAVFPKSGKGLRTVLPAAVQHTVFSRAYRVNQLSNAYKALSAQGHSDAAIEGYVKKLWAGLKSGAIKFDPATDKDFVKSFLEVGG